MVPLLTSQLSKGYAPTKDAEPEEEEAEFFDTLQSIIDKVQKEDL